MSTNDPKGDHNSEDSIDCLSDNLADNQCSDVSPKADNPLHSQPNTLSTAGHKVMASQESPLIVWQNGRQYSRNSFDRIGDDLSELLLSYLPIEEKFRFECLSKQWQRVVFNKVIHFENVSYIKQIECFTDNDFKTVIEKFHNLKTISLYVNSKTVSSLSLSDNFHRLESIKLYVDKEVSSQVLTEFCQTFGTKVEEIDVWNVSDKTSLLEWCPNLKQFDFHDCDQWLCVVDNQLVPTLNTFNCEVDNYQMSAFGQLVDKYQNTMKKISVYGSLNAKDDVSQVFQQLTRLKNLECLELKIQTCVYVSINLDLTPDITYLCEHCPKLTNLKLKISNANLQLSRPSKALMGLKKLNIRCRDLTKNLFDIISDLAPNLEEFSFAYYGRYKYSSKHLIDLSRMKYLKRLTLLTFKCMNHSVNDSGVIQLLDNCKKLKVLELIFLSNIEVKTIEKLKEVANNRPKEIIRFWTRFVGNKSEAFCDSIKEMPINLICRVY